MGGLERRCWEVYGYDFQSNKLALPGKSSKVFEMSYDVGGSFRGEIYQLFCLLEKSLVRININRTANRHRWMGREY